MKIRKSLRLFLEYSAIKGILSALGSLSRPNAIVVGRTLARAAFATIGSFRRIGTDNLHLAFPKLNESERRRLLRASFDNLGRQLGEFSQLSKATPESLRAVIEYDPESVQRFEEVRARGRGIVIITGHLGGWELLAFAHSAFGNPIAFLMRPLPNPKVEAMVRAIRTRFGNVPVDKKDAGLGAMRILKRGGTLGVLADLNSLPQEGVFTPFFGELACTTGGVAALAVPTNATLFPVFAPWVEERKRYVIYGGPVLELIRTGDFENDLRVNTARVAARIEQEVRRWPEQWLWLHDRWHARPRPWDRICTKFPPV